MRSPHLGRTSTREARSDVAAAVIASFRRSFGLGVLVSLNPVLVLSLSLPASAAAVLMTHIICNYLNARDRRDVGLSLHVLDTRGSLDPIGPYIELARVRECPVRPRAPAPSPC